MNRLRRAVLFGAACGVAAGALSLVPELALLSSRLQAEMPPGASGGLGAVSAPFYAPFAALVSLVVGAVWRWRRLSKREALAKVR